MTTRQREPCENQTGWRCCAVAEDVSMEAIDTVLFDYLLKAAGTFRSLPIFRCFVMGSN